MHRAIAPVIWTVALALLGPVAAGDPDARLEAAPVQPPWPRLHGGDDGNSRTASALDHITVAAHELLTGNSTFWHRDWNHTFPLFAVEQVAGRLAVGPSSPQRHFYPNLTIVFKGHWDIANTSSRSSSLWPSAAPSAEVAELLQAQPATHPERTLAITFLSRPTDDDDIHAIWGSARIRLKSGNQWFYTQGAYFVRTGTAILATSSKRSAFARLPFWMPSPELFDQMQRFVQGQLGRDDFDERFSRYLGRHDHESLQTLANFTEDCEPFLLLQLSDIPSDVAMIDIRHLEEELVQQQGLPTMRPIKVTAEGFLFTRSDACGEIILTLNVTGVRLPVFYNKLNNYVSFAIVVLLCQLLLTAYQMEHLHSQSTLLKVSVAMLGCHTLLDCYMSLFHLAVGSSFAHVFNGFAALAFLNIVQFSIFENRLMFSAWKVQNNQIADAEERRQSVRMLYVYYYGILFTGIFASSVLEGVLARLAGIALHAFWVPQIIHNIQHNTRKALSPVYVIGISIARYVMVAYFSFCSENVFGVEPYPWTGWFLLVFLILQVIILLLQDMLGARFFVPQQWSPPVYTYHTRLSPSDVARSEEGRATDDVNCVICMLPIDRRQTHMLTPCNHMFHATCLEEWMQFKMECPTCRAALPPLT